jgi:superfamily II DNA or RNA helicase
MFRPNQHAAIKASLSNDFSSGVHYHATGTGKSWIALQLALEFQKRQKSSHILWICEQKSILVEQFAKETLKARGFSDILKTFLLLDYSSKKPADWVQQTNSARIWGKPLLLVINRAFLTSSLKYQDLRIPIGLLIHDECHSIMNATTQAFYKWLHVAQPATKCIGFSATPTLTHAPYTSLPLL